MIRRVYTITLNKEQYMFQLATDLSLGDVVVKRGSLVKLLKYDKSSNQYLIEVCLMSIIKKVWVFPERIHSFCKSVLNN